MARLNVDQLIEKVRSLLVKDGYAFSEEDKALLEAILVELEDVSKRKSGLDPSELLKYLSILLRFLKFFGVDDITNLF